MTTLSHLKTFNALITDTMPWQDKFTDEIDQLKSMHKAFEDKLTRLSTEEQTLNIAIMGQVKAGKSSFLNALLFEGKPILPEAATPKTANLTRISYAEKPRIEVDFYSTADWQKICDLAKSTFTYQEAKIAREQVEMVSQAGIDPIKILEQGVNNQEADSLDEIMHQLNDYAGNDGKYTALVKMIRLYLPLPELEGYNIIDTPGMNDPVVSRTQRTKEEMASSDVVFFLSRASNFLDTTDTDLISRQLPDAGIKRLVLVAGQYDAAIEQDGYSRKSLIETEKNLHSRISKRAKEDISNLVSMKEQAGQNGVAHLLNSITQPLFSSTYAYGFANWDKANWNNGMQHDYKNLCELAEDEWSYEFTQQDWQRIAGFEQLREAYNQARQDKAIIIQEQKDNLLPEAERNLSAWSNVLREHIKQRIMSLEQDDIADLDNKKHQYQHKIDELSGKLEMVLGHTIESVKLQQQAISKDLQQGMEENNRLQTRIGTKTESESYYVSSSKWYKPWTWGNQVTRYRTKSINYEFISATDVVEQITNYAYSCANEIEHHFEQMVNPSKIKTQLRKTLLESLDTRSLDFDPAQFRSMLDNAIGRIYIPELSLDIGNAGDNISQKFGNEVDDDEGKSQLKKELKASLAEVFSTLNNDLNNSVNRVVLSLQETQTNLSQNLNQSMQQEIEQLMADLDNKMESVKSYQQLFDIINSYYSKSISSKVTSSYSGVRNLNSTSQVTLIKSNT
ncbi:dynamin family protein [Psychrobacter faecalis]